MGAEIVSFAFYGAAIPKARAGRNGNFSYTPKRNAAFEANIRAIGAVSMAKAGQSPTPDAVRAEMAFTRCVPKSWSKAKAAQMLGQPIVGRPDIDNLAKAIMDALNGVTYEDDGQVSALHVTGRWGAVDSVQVRISLDDGPGVLAEAA